MEYKIKDIKPVGNFKPTLEMIAGHVQQLEDQNKYTTSVANHIKLIVGDLGIPDALIISIQNGTAWNIEEAKICLLYTYYLIIRLNNIAQKYLNNIEMPDNNIQLMERVNDDPKLKKIFGKLTIKY